MDTRPTARTPSGAPADDRHGAEASTGGEPDVAGPETETPAAGEARPGGDDAGSQADALLAALAGVDPAEAPDVADRLVETLTRELDASTTTPLHPGRTSGGDA